MTALIVLMIVIAVIAGVIAGAKGGKKDGSKGKHTPITSRKPLTDNEQPMYFRLKDALPEHVILAQVAFSAMLKTTAQATRSRYDRKVADFVVCTNAFDVVAILELDDASHRGREKQDAERDAILESAGLKVLRYKRTPDIEQVKDDIKKLLP